MDFLHYKSQRLHPFFQVIGVERGMGRGVGGCGLWNGERGDVEGLRKGHILSILLRSVIERRC